MLAALFSVALACPPHLDRRADAAGVTFSWRVQDDHLVGRVSAQSDGWVVVGFNDAPALDGSRLVFLAVDDHDGIVAEQHVARPPHHFLVDVIASDQVAGGRSGSAVWASFVMPLDHDALLSLRSGQTIWLTLAWSHSLDLFHHSARREMVAVTL
ncbi:MAG: hypothetical protein AAFV53_14385 [Myxococcota bacterium]